MKVINGDTFFIEQPSKGDKLFEQGDMPGAIKAYRKEYKKDPNGIAYNFACAFARNNEVDSAFRYLTMDVKRDTVFMGVFALSDPDFINLRSDARWVALRDTITSRFLAKRPGMITNMPLAVKLWDMMAWDQAYYSDIEICEKKLGRNSPIVAAMWHLKELINRDNMQALDSIIAIHGWPKLSEVGNTASTSAFLIVQHSDLKTQEKYLPLIKSLCEEGEANWSAYALMYDRVQVSQNKPQLYGSQLSVDPLTGKMKFFPIEDEPNVNKRRAEVGLGPIELYAEMFGIKYEGVK